MAINGHQLCKNYNFKMRDFHLPLVNKYHVKILVVSQLNTKVTIHGHQLCKKL